MTADNVCFSPLKHFLFKMFSECHIMMMSLGVGPIGRGGGVMFFFFITFLLYCLHLFYSCLSEGLVQSSGTHLDVQGGVELWEGWGCGVVGRWGHVGASGVKCLFIFQRLATTLIPIMMMMTMFM